jgi:hypothetical protein
MPMADDKPSQVSRCQVLFCQVLFFDVTPIRNLRASPTRLLAWLAVAACLMAWPLPLAAAEADDPCKMLDKRLVDIGTETPAYKKAKEVAEANKTPAAGDKKIVKFAVNELVNRPSPFHAELSSDRLPSPGTAWVTFEDKKITDANVGKLCVKAYAQATSDEPKDVSVRQVFLSEKDDHSKALKVVFQVDPVPGDPLYARVDYLFVGLLEDGTHFTYFKRVTVTNNRTTTLLSLFFVALAYLSLASATYKADDAGDLTGPGWLAYALSPIRISAAWFGEASMSQVQLILFTFIVAGLLFHLWASTGALSDISTGLLTLLGISAVGAGGAKFTQTLKTNPRPETARFLMGKGWYDWRPLPVRTCATLRNLLLTDGRLDVYKFQMAIFTVVVACYVVSSGQTGLGEVKISEAILYLMGISQGVYVGGKAVTDRTTDLDEAVKKMIDLESQILALPDGTQRTARLAEYGNAAKVAVLEFAPLYNRRYRTQPQDAAPTGDNIDPAILRP